MSRLSFSLNSFAANATSLISSVAIGSSSGNATEAAAGDAAADQQQQQQQGAPSSIDGAFDGPSLDTSKLPSLFNLLTDHAEENSWGKKVEL
jgi:hypothetical protein